MLLKLVFLPLYLVYWMFVLFLKIAFFPLLLFIPRKREKKEHIPVWAYLLPLALVMDHKQ